ncbi:MAG: hypothetical protein VZR95_07455 [Alphaproteobacteria bacterium]|jgi:hypothetical protein
MKLNKKSLSGNKSSCQSSSSQSSGCGCGTKKGSVYEEDIDVEISE